MPSLSLITASILSKKLAEGGLRALIMDVKFGRAAFMTSREQARELAQAIVSLASSCGVQTRALLTDMNRPLGRAGGNWLEVKESVECLEGKGPADLQELVLACAAHLLMQTGRASNLFAAQALASDCLASGKPRAKWDELLAAQGAHLEAFRKRLALDHTAPVVTEVPASRTGYVTRCDARILGEVIRDLGGGRMTRESSIDPDVGLDRLVKPAEKVEAGFPLGRIHARRADEVATALTRVQAAFEISEARPAPSPLIAEIVEGNPLHP